MNPRPSTSTRSDNLYTSTTPCRSSVFSDALNHASMIEGILYSKAAKAIFRHNEPEHLDRLLGEADTAAAKLVAFESVYSMDGDIAPIAELCEVAEKHGEIGRAHLNSSH